MSDLLQQGIAAARAGRREEARQLLMQVVDVDERSEQGWLWLAGVVDDPADMRACLQNVLDLNPANQQARQGLAWIESRYGPPGLPAHPPEPPVSPTAPPVEREISVSPPQPAQTLAPTDDRRSYTGPTSKLAAEAPIVAASVAAPAVTRPAAPKEPIAAPPPEHPCPYCGAPTVLKQQSCTQCRGDLMVRAAPPEKRSLALTVRGVLWGIGGRLTLLMTALTFFLFLRVRQDARAASGAASSDALLLGVAFLLVIGLLYIGIARGLLARRRWAFYVNMVLIALSLFGTLSSVAAGALLVGILGASLGRTGNAASTAGIISLILVVVLGIGFVLLPIILTVLSARDFFGPKLRFQPTVESADHLVHYNNGIAYKNRGMWYMAAQEWEAAVSKKPREPNYLHALGLAYAQLKQPDKARATLDRALQSAPDNLQIKESRALIDQIATKK
ncbi:MAG TPA: tetratricopeptide repeat protein [Roseiflexaceae bacterium]|nr:tetratricopeptide repeat protein [Roseiflexaceae bacterium]